MHAQPHRAQITKLNETELNWYQDYRYIVLSPLKLSIKLPVYTRLCSFSFFCSSVASRGHSWHNRWWTGQRSAMVGHCLTTCHMLCQQPREDKKNITLLISWKWDIHRALSVVSDLCKPIRCFCLILPLTACPISPELLTKHQINYPLAFSEVDVLLWEAHQSRLACRVIPCKLQKSGWPRLFQKQHNAAPTFG